MKDYYWLDAKSTKFLRNGYILEEEDPIQRVKDIADAAQAILIRQLPEDERSAERHPLLFSFAERFEANMAKGWYSLSSPVWANFGRKRGLPISCNGSYIPDTMQGILFKAAEVGMMSKHGAGTSGYFGDLRPRGGALSDNGTASGPVHMMEIFDTVAEVVSQAGVRRGNFAAYMNVEHPDIEEFLQIRGEGHAIQHMSIGVTISDEWMQTMIDGDKFKREIWAKIIKKRFESGYPYIMFSDTVNNNAPEVFKKKGLKIYASNLCSEICLPSDEFMSFVCNLASMNILHFEEWEGTDAVEILFYFLDAVMSEYIDKVKEIPFMQAAYKFAVAHRAIGLGALGWQSFLQSKMIPFESFEAKMWNVKWAKALHEKTLKATKELAALFGEPEIMEGTGMRNSTRIAIAPTTSSSFILRCSKSVEVESSNYFVQDLAKGKFTSKNPYLKKTLHAHDKDDDETWRDILVHGGSVQHLSFLNENEKDVFKTFGEISQKEIIIQAAQRQKYIDQSQSINLMIHPATPAKEVSQLLIEAWKLGVKTLYYQKGTNPAQELGRSILSCKSCES